jgi:hypothetical protein
MPQKWVGTAYPRGLPLDIVTAGGQVVDDDWIVYFNTVTGVVISVDTTSKGKLVLHGTTSEERYIVKVYPAPLSTRPCRRLVIPRSLM